MDFLRRIFKINGFDILMPNLTLNEQSYLCDFIKKVLPVTDYDKLWDMSEKISREQRGRLLSLCFNKKTEELKSMVDEIINFQQYEHTN